MQVCEDDFVMVVKTESGRLTAHQVSWREEGAEPGEIGQWEGVANMLVGDFAGLGHEQLLLILSEEGEREREREGCVL